MTVASRLSIVAGTSNGPARGRGRHLQCRGIAGEPTRTGDGKPPLTCWPHSPYLPASLFVNRILRGSLAFIRGLSQVLSGRETRRWQRGEALRGKGPWPHLCGGNGSSTPTRAFR